jgi:hypothetical protein
VGRLDRQRAVADAVEQGAQRGGIHDVADRATRLNRCQPDV